MTLGRCGTDSKVRFTLYGYSCNGSEGSYQIMGVCFCTVDIGSVTCKGLLALAVPVVVEDLKFLSSD